MTIDYAYTTEDIIADPNIEDYTKFRVLSGRMDDILKELKYISKLVRTNTRIVPNN